MCMKVIRSEQEVSRNGKGLGTALVVCDHRSPGPDALLYKLRVLAFIKHKGMYRNSRTKKFICTSQ